MTQIDFFYDGKTIAIQSNLKEKMRDIFQKFITKTQTEKKSVYYLYQGKLIDIESELELEKIIGKEDKKSNKIKIIANKIEETNKGNNLVKSKCVVCPECKENTFIKIKDYKIELYNCKNNHQINDILLDKYEQLQFIDISKIVCNKCKENKGIHIIMNFLNVLHVLPIYALYASLGIIKSIML